MKNPSLLGYLYLALTIGLTVYGQVVLKWRMNLKGNAPEGFLPLAGFMLRTLCDVYVVSTYVAALLASLAWMAAMTKFELSFAYPFTSLAFVLVLLIGVLWLGETFTIPKLLGMSLIVLGVAIAARG